MRENSHIFLFSGAHPAGVLGATRAVDLGLVEALARRGCSVDWLARGADADPPVRSIDLDSLPLGLAQKLAGDGRSFFARALHKLGRRQWASLMLYSEYDKRAASVIPELLRSTDSGPVLIGRSGMSGQAFAAARAAKARIVLRSQWLHPLEHARLLGTELERMGFQSAGIPRSRLRRQAEQMKQADLIWCNSSLVIDSYRNHGVPEERLIYTPLGVDLARYGVGETHLETLYRRRKQNFKVLFVGSVNPEKGVHLLIEALLKAPVRGCELVLNGAVAPYFRNTLEEFIVKLSQKNIRVTIQAGDPRSNYRSASMLVLPSVHESFGLVVLEAMAAGLPVVVSTNVGAKDCVRDGRDGLHVRAFDVAHLAESIQLLYSDRELLETLGRSARLAVNNFTWDAVAGQFLAAIARRA